METSQQAKELLDLINREAEEKQIFKSYVALIGNEPNVVSRAKILVNEARRNFKNGDSLIDKLLRIDAKYF
jgi:hypothetical protein